MADVNTNTATQTQEQGNSTQTNTTANANTTGAGADSTPKVKTEEEIRAELQKEYEKMADKRVTDAIKKKEKEWADKQAKEKMTEDERRQAEEQERLQAQAKRDLDLTIKDRNGGLVIVDTWKRGGDRTNSNFCVMGNSGVGKSTAIKHILLSEYMKGTRIIVIDPESEYRDLCQNLNGDWINAVGGSKGMINPLQVRPSPRDDEDEKEELRLYRDEGYGMNDLALHMKNLEIFFSLYIPSLTDMQKAVLKKCLVELYQKFHITWDTDVTKLKPQDFPIFSDLYALVQEKTKTEKENQVYTDLAMLLYDIAEGADSFIWNGHTTVSGNSRFTVMDTHALQETGDNIKRTQYFNILTYDWEQMSRDREERVLLICDEAYLMIDRSVPQSLVYLRNVMKRARKYEAALGIISHSLVDFLHESIKQYGQALLDIPCYKILMGTDGKNLKETADLYDLTEAEKELLLARKRGHALFMAGAKRLHIQFDIPEYKFNYMGKGGGR